MHSHVLAGIVRRRAYLWLVIAALVAGFLAAGGGNAHRAHPVKLLGPGALLNAAFTGHLPMYMRFPGVSTGVGGSHTGDIIISSFQFGVGRGISSPTGGSADRESSAPSVSEITVTKVSDSYTVGLLDQVLQEASTAVAGVTVKLYVIRPDGSGGTAEELQALLNGTVVTGDHMTGQSSGKTSESISLNFTKITWSYTAKNKPAVKACYDLATAKKC
ncbi:MAG: type secretion system secreted protein Hcp [Frankiaceae bacterium]|jgi:type VI secretion system secreted protein Hcp|nr:type secretion system secreted protein Hcp [Frankiaceae bacterium]